jgi:hypothetical protein
MMLLLLLLRNGPTGSWCDLMDGYIGVVVGRERVLLIWMFVVVLSRAASHIAVSRYFSVGVGVGAGSINPLSLH